MCIYICIYIYIHISVPLLLGMLGRCFRFGANGCLPCDYVRARIRACTHTYINSLPSQVCRQMCYAAHCLTAGFLGKPNLPTNIVPTNIA